LLDQKDSAPPPPAPAQVLKDTTRSLPTIHILDPFASFLGTDRMTKRGCLTAVLTHVYGGSSATGDSLIDKDDNDYVLTDTKLQPLIHKFRKKYRVKLRKLVRYVCKFMVPEDKKKRRGKVCLGDTSVVR
jgi:hypothetical protein